MRQYRFYEGNQNVDCYCYQRGLPVVNPFRFLWSIASYVNADFSITVQSFLPGYFARLFSSVVKRWPYNLLLSTVFDFCLTSIFFKRLFQAGLGPRTSSKKQLCGLLVFDWCVSCRRANSLNAAMYYVSWWIDDTVIVVSVRLRLGSCMEMWWRGIPWIPRNGLPLGCKRNAVSATSFKCSSHDNVQ